MAPYDVFWGIGCWLVEVVASQTLNLDDILDIMRFNSSIVNIITQYNIEQPIHLLMLLLLYYTTNKQWEQKQLQLQQQQQQKNQSTDWRG